jgi:adenylate cyclase
MDAEQLLALCPDTIEKTRWLVPCLSPQTSNLSPLLIWEVDEFHGRLAGRVLAELELPTEDTPFVKPAWLGEEVTGNPAWYNANM